MATERAAARAAARGACYDTLGDFEEGPRGTWTTEGHLIPEPA